MIGNRINQNLLIVLIRRILRIPKQTFYNIVIKRNWIITRKNFKGTRKKMCSIKNRMVREN